MTPAFLKGDFRARFGAPSYDITNRQSFENTMQWIEAASLLWKVLEGQVFQACPLGSHLYGGLIWFNGI